MYRDENLGTIIQGLQRWQLLSAAVAGLWDFIVIVSLLYHTFVSYSFLQFYSIIINIFTCIRFSDFIISFLSLLICVIFLKKHACFFCDSICDWTGEKEKDENDASFIFLILCLIMNAYKTDELCESMLFLAMRFKRMGFDPSSIS